MTKTKQLYETLKNSDCAMRLVMEQIGVDFENYDEENTRDCFITALEGLYHGFASGVNGFIYYDDTTRFYDAHSEQIAEFLQDTIDQSTLMDIIKDRLSVQDVIECNRYAKNCYVWLFAEEVLHEWEEELREIAKESLKEAIEE